MIQTTFMLYNIVPLGFSVLLAYIFIDIFCDLFRNRKKSSLKRILLYSFLFYLLSLIQIKFGGFTIPTQVLNNYNSTFISTNDWFGIYNIMNDKVSIDKLSFIYNVLLFIPLGSYLLFLFKIRNISKVIIIVSLSCLGILILSVILKRLGLVLYGFNILDIIYLLLNICGGILGFLLSHFIVRTRRVSHKQQNI